MKTTTLVLLVPLLALAVTTTGLGQSLPRSSPLAEADMAEIVGMGACALAEGFMAGAALGAAVAVFVPGAQGTAAILGFTVAAFKIGTVIAC
jgi:hypothetical protein